MSWVPFAIGLSSFLSMGVAGVVQDKDVKSSPQTIIKPAQKTQIGHAVKKFALSALLILAQISSATFAATFRNHEKTLFRPTICATLLSEFVDQGSDRPNVGRLLESLFDRIRNLAEQMPQELQVKAAQSLKKKKSWRFQFDMRGENWHEDLPLVAGRVAGLNLISSGLTPDHIVWIRAVKGSEAIKKNLVDRRQRLIETQRAVRAEFQKLLPSSRAENVVHLSITTGLYAFLAVNAIDGLIGGNLKQLLEPFLLYFIGYSQYHITLRSLQEMGMLPIETSQRITRFEIQYMNYLDRVLTRLEGFQPDDLVTFTELIPITSEQFSAMKSCNADKTTVDPEVIAGSCVVENMLRADVLFANKKLGAVLDGEMRAQQVDPRWSNPMIQFDEMLIADPQTGEPVMVSVMVIRANQKLPQKKDNKPKPKEQESKGLLPGYVPAGA